MLVKSEMKKLPSQKEDFSWIYHQVDKEGGLLDDDFFLWLTKLLQVYCLFNLQKIDMIEFCFSNHCLRRVIVGQTLNYLPEVCDVNFVHD